MERIADGLRRSLRTAGLAAALLLPGLTAYAQGVSWPGPTVETSRSAACWRAASIPACPASPHRTIPASGGASTSPIAAPSPRPLLHDPEKVKYVPTTAAARFTILQSGEIDVLIRDCTLTFNRSVQLGLDEIAVTFYAGEGFLVSKKLGVSRSPS